MIQENGRVGALFASKAFVQLIVNPLVGKATNNWGYEIPFMIGTCILLVSALSKCLQKPKIIHFIFKVDKCGRIWPRVESQ